MISRACVNVRTTLHALDASRANLCAEQRRHDLHGGRNEYGSEGGASSQHALATGCSVCQQIRLRCTCGRRRGGASVSHREQRQLQQHALLRVCGGRLGRRHAQRVRVKAVDAVAEAAEPNADRSASDLLCYLICYCTACAGVRIFAQ